MRRKVFTALVVISAILYITILYQMLFRGFGRANVLLSEDMQPQYAFSLVPFQTIGAYIAASMDDSMRGYANMNLVGNLLLLFPLGFYLPFFFKKAAAFKAYAITAAALIVLIEAAQLITMTGSLDIDDFMLNFAGALLGFLVFKRTPLRSLFKWRAY